MTSSSTKWAPSIHRFGKPVDHCLLQIGWKWRVKCCKRAPTKDFKAMDSAEWSALNTQIASNMQKCASPTPPGTRQIDAQLAQMNDCISSAIEKCVPVKSKATALRRRVSDRTRAIYEERAKRFSSIIAKGGKIGRSMRRRWNAKVKNSNLKDYTDWLEAMTKDIEEADRRGDSRSIFWSTKVVCGTAHSFTSKTPSKHDGKLILDQEELAEVWRSFLEKKFSATAAEAERAAYEPLGQQSEEDPLTEQAFVRALIKLKANKACGPDGIPGVVFQNCESAARALYEILCAMWESEYVPPQLVRASFIMLYKDKGSVDDLTKYRCIGLLPHSYKLLSIILLERLNAECAGFLSD